MNPDSQQLPPFLTRENLKFGNNAKLELQVVSQANATVVLDVVYVNREGMSKFKHTTSSAGAQSTSVFLLSDIPIAVSVVDSLGSFTQGDCYVTVRLLLNGEVVFETCSGFVYKAKSISYPVNNTNDAIPGRGRIRLISGSDPIAGDEISELVPANRIWHLLTLNFNLVTSGTAGNRQTAVYVGIGSGGAMAIAGTATQAASLTRVYTIGKYGGLATQTFNNRILLNMPSDLYIPSGNTFDTSTLNLDSADQFSVIRFLVEEFYV